MRALLILAVLLPMGGLVAWGVSHQALAASRRRRHIRELEAENARLDAIHRRLAGTTGVTGPTMIYAGATGAVGGPTVGPTGPAGPTGVGASATGPPFPTTRVRRRTARK